MVALFGSTLSELDKPNTAILMASLVTAAAFGRVDHDVVLKRHKHTFGLCDTALS